MRENNWTIKKIMKGKAIPFIIMTLILTKLFYELANKGLNFYLNQFTDHPLYTQNYSLGKYGLFLIIPAAIITLIMLKLYVKIRKTPYENESDFSPARLKELSSKIYALLTGKIANYVILLIGAYISARYLIEYINVIKVMFPAIQHLFVRWGTMPIIYLIGAIYLGSIGFMANLAFSKTPMKRSSKYAAQFGFLALLLLLSGAFGFIFSVLGIISSIFGIINDRGEGRKVAILGLIASLVTLLVLILLALAGIFF